MNKLLKLFLLSVLLAATCTQAIAQEGHEAQEEHKAAGHAEGGEAEHAEETPLQAIARWMNFLILFGGLAYLLRIPMRDFFVSRRKEIGHGIQRAKDAQAGANARLDEIEQRLGALSAEVAALNSDAQKEALAERERILREAKREVDRVIDQSRQEIDRIARSIERSVREKVADLVIDRAGKTLRTEMTQDDHKRVIVRFVKKL